MEALVGADRVRVEHDALLLAVEPERAAVVARELILAGVELFELRRTERPLEEVFLELTEGRSAGAESIREGVGAA